MSPRTCISPNRNSSTISCPLAMRQGSVGASSATRRLNNSSSDESSRAATRISSPQSTSHVAEFTNRATRSASKSTFDYPQHSVDALRVESFGYSCYVTFSLAIHDLAGLVPPSCPEPNVVFALNDQKGTVVERSCHLDLRNKRTRVFLTDQHLDRVSQASHQIFSITDNKRRMSGDHRVEIR